MPASKRAADIRLQNARRPSSVTAVVVSAKPAALSLKLRHDMQNLLPGANSRKLGFVSWLEF
jgi:hypothetical protein